MLKISDEYYPKVLIINVLPINSCCPIGYTMQHLFSSYPPDKILQYYTIPCKLNQNNKSKYYAININLPIIKKASISSNIFEQLPKETKSMIAEYIKLLIKMIVMIVPVYFCHQLINEIKRFKPDVIYTQGYSTRMLKVVLKLSTILKCPIVLHTLDDWMEIENKTSWFASYSEKLLKKILSNGETHMVVSPSMQRMFFQRYSIKTEFVCNCEKYSDIRQINENTSIKKVIYTGNLTPKRYIPLSDFANCINKINEGKDIYDFYVYTVRSHIEQYKSYFSNKVIFHDCVETNEVYSLLMNSDILIHVESFDSDALQFAKYSLSTKIAEYLSAGKPLVYYGPLNVGVALFLLENKIGICTDNIDELYDILKKLSEDDEYYNHIAKVCYEKGKQFFNDDIMQTKLLKCLRKEL